MNEAHRGKIGHLPKALKEQVNRRLEKGEKGRTLVACPCRSVRGNQAPDSKINPNQPKSTKLQ